MYNQDHRPLEFDPLEFGSFRVSGSEATQGQLVIFYPAAKHGRPSVVNSAGLGEINKQEAPGDNLYLIAAVTGSDWSVEVST